MTEDPDLVAADDEAHSEIRTGLDRIVAGSNRIFSWAIFAAFVISVIEIFARYLLNSPTFWAHETTTFLIAAIFLLGGPIALARDRHIRVRIIYDAVSPQKRRWLDILNSSIALVFFAGLAHASWIMTSRSIFTPTGQIRLEGTGTAWNPPTPALLKMLVLFCVVLMFVQTLLHLVSAIRRRPMSPGRDN